MSRAIAGVSATLVWLAGALTGCAQNGTNGLTGTSLAGLGPAAQTQTDADASARASRVAGTIARARSCALALDEAKLRSAYLRYEAQQGAVGPQLAAIEKSYDAARSASAPRGCADQERAAVQRDLQRYAAGVFASRARTASSAEDDSDTSPFGSNRWWDDQDRDGGI